MLHSDVNLVIELASEGIRSDFETQHKHRQKLETGVSVVPSKGLKSSKIFTIDCNDLKLIQQSCSFVLQYSTLVTLGNTPHVKR